MADEKIKFGMDIKEMLMVMSNGNPGAISCLMEMLKEPEGLLDILYLDSMGIYGSKIYMLWNDCCDRDMDKMFKTLQYFRSGAISHEEIHANLDKVRATPFI